MYQIFVLFWFEILSTVSNKDTRNTGEPTLEADFFKSIFNIRIALKTFTTTQTARDTQVRLAHTLQFFVESKYLHQHTLSSSFQLLVPN